MTITELKARYKELNPEGYFFSPETNRVWGSSVEKVHEHDSGNIFFITKESNFDGSKKLLSVRMLKNKQNGGVKTLQFQETSNIVKATKTMMHKVKEFEDNLRDSEQVQVTPQVTLQAESKRYSLLPAETGSVIQNIETGKKFVVKEPIYGWNPKTERFICNKPHEDGDFSYLCTNQYCRCMQ